MSSTAEKTNQPATVVQQKAQQQSFFRKAEEESFFGSNERPSFFSKPVQAKLAVSSPDDPQEKEADAVAETVMRMPDPVTSISASSEEKLDKKEEEEIQAKIEAPAISKISRKEEEGEEIQAKHISTIYRMSEESLDSGFSDSDGGSATETISRKKSGTYHSDIIQRSGRSPPRESIPFEQTLSSSKGSGSALPGDTREFMESRFNADFSGVRIHTGATAQAMSSNIHAQAFAHGNDIYFNEGKFSPQTESGGTLLAHELTHTIQQGASPAKTSTSIAPKTIARKNSIQRSSAGVPVQLTNAVEKAKTVEGKIDANKPQADGFRTGWEHLVDIFKTTFGEDKVISGGGGSSVEGAVAEQDIKKKREQDGVMVVDSTTVTTSNAIAKTKTGSRDAMPSWCGIFAFWALNKSGVPMPKWKLGERMIKPEAARLPGSPPMPGDIAYRNAYSHFALVESASGNTVKTVNGNTAGEDNLGGQVQTKENPLSDWTAFFNPLLIMQGSLGSGEGAVEEKPKTLKELRKELFNVSRKEDSEQEKTEDTSETGVQAKPELSTWSIGPDGALNTNNTIQQKTEPEELQKKEEETQEEEKVVSPKLFSVQKKESNGSEVEKEEVQSEFTPSASTARVQTKQVENTNTSYSTTTGNTLALSADVHSRGPPVRLHNNGNIIQGGWFDDALSFVDSAIDFVAEGLAAGKRLLLNEARDFVMAIPGYKALRVVLAEDPITGEEIERNGHNFIEAAFDIMPGGNLLYDKLNELGALTEAEQWIDRRIVGIENLVSNVVSRVETFWNGLTLESLASPTQIFEDAGNIIHGTISDIVNFAKDAATELLEIVKRWLLTQLVDFIKEHTTAYPLLTVILGEDPITGARVEKNGSTILSAILELGGEVGIQQRTQMQETGTFQKAADWIDRGISVFGNLLQTITNNFGLIWSVVSIDALMHPIDKFNEIYNTFAGPVADVLKFMADTAVIILKFIKEVLMVRLSTWARGTRGYFLVTVIIGKDPFTEAIVERNTENIIHGFMSLMEGGEEQFQQMKESGSIARATQRIDAAVERLNMTPAAIVQLFIDLWNSFSINDLIHPIAAFQRIIATFGEPIGRLIAFVVEIVKIVVVVILEIMNFPFDLINNIIAKAMQAIDLIKRDPIGFLKNLLRAIKEGFMQFFENILTHLFNGLKAWFLSEVKDAGIPIPTDFSVMGLIKWLLVVLDITMEKIWKKLEERIGKPKVDKIKKMIETAEHVASAAGEAYQFMKDVQERGFMAVMIDKVKEQLSNVWEMVLDSVKSFVMDQIITKVTTKLLSMLDPTGIMAVINSAIALYKAIQSFLKYLREMLQIVNSFVEGTLQIAQGATKKAADFLEGALARGVPIVIGFLANQVGLNLSERLRDALEMVREKVDKGLTWVIDKLVTLIEKLVSMGKAAVASLVEWWKGKKEFTAADGKHHEIFFQGQGESAVLIIKSDPKPYTNFLNSYLEQLKKDGQESEVDPVSGKTKSEVITEAKVVAVDIESEKKKKIAEYDGADDKAKETTKKTAVDTLLTKLATLSIPLFGVAKDKPRDDEIVIPAGSNTNEFATTQEVNLIWNTPKVKGNGSGPDTSAKHAIYDKIDFRQKGGGSYYIRGHLINDNLGGPGKWNNMTALSRTANHEHEEKVESKVKASFNIGAVIRYKVTASGNQNVKKVTADDKDKFPKIADFATALPYLEQITEAESKVPTSLACEAYTMKKNGDVWEKDKEIVTDTITFNVGDYADYELGELGGTVTLNLEKLKEEAIKSNLTYTQFRNQDKIHENSIGLLDAAKVGELEKIFTEKERDNARKEELNRISDEITTWIAFTAGRAFYNIKTDAAYSEVETAFNSKQTELRNGAISAAKTKAEGAQPNAFSNMNWIDFKIAEKINFKANTDEASEIAKIENTFRNKQ
ncbi:MAG: DUF4157 domain-containing protein [Prolixibacteraceae bacterium]|nr:DUF4157 domain-containing protein [Prolixibacteraceae bacterium]